MANPAISYAFAQEGAGDEQSTASAGTNAIPTIRTGRSPRFLMFTQTSASACLIAVGDSTVDTANEVHFALTNQHPVVVEVAGQTHYAYSLLASNTIVVTPLTNGGGIAA